MNGELIDSAWRVLPNEFKEEVKKRYKGCLFTANRYAKVEADLLEEFFGINNLTSDAEGEEDEMLYVSRKQVQEIYSQNQKEIHRECVSSSDKDCYETVNEVLKTLFGSKCLPDNVDSSEPNVDSSHDNVDSSRNNVDSLEPNSGGLNEDNFAKSEPKPAESKYHIGQRVRHIPTRLVDVIDGISQSAPYIYHFKHMVDPINGQGIFESDLEPYTEPSPNQFREPTKKIDHIADVRNMMPNRLQIASMAMQGMLSNTTRFSSYEISVLVRISLNCADVLIAEAEKGGKA